MVDQDSGGRSQLRLAETRRTELVPAGTHALAAVSHHGDLQQRLVGDLVRRGLGHAPRLRARAQSVAWCSTEQ